ncbi:MAG: NADH-quinone oxidoreductase subunit NuoE [Pseudomonadota bacterium]
MSNRIVSEMKRVISDYEGGASALIPVLQEIQGRYNYLPEEAIDSVAEGLSLPLSQVYRVATFYDVFSLTPRGKHVISVCLGTCCHVNGNSEILDELKRNLGIGLGETTKDSRFRIEAVRCLGCCALSPAVKVNDDIYARLTREEISDIIESYK